MPTKPVEHAVKIRPAISGDMEILGSFGAMLVALHHKLDSKRFIEAAKSTPARYAHFLESQLARPEVIVMVAEENGALLGYAYAELEGFDYMALRGPAGVIHDLFVDPGRRREGVGRMLLEAAMARLQSLGADRFVLSTAHRNETARSLFAAIGFRPTMIEMTREADEAAG
ncbi:ribosomal protein S18 acetylase RimI-like enzyme [Rhizobium sp. BK529]|uniref:GNAT family N-acetyltransferase n=1 Tax=unclassified Rhizobium TaxID=2613769 RepID=UPI001043637D|nr:MULTISPECIES: GNAT family N-acetyltransferase [unclassified Rhizobium]MBB3590759.1 ribosomal protein S18 acetylase RimI-like enzyme [Rhizobium sp. BK529]TCS09284.1 acetyltransferase (GNAT) family protein [Rhizobium sp. BK418]